MAGPFLGGGASLAFFRPRRALLGDVDPHLVAFYQRLRDADPAFTESLWGIGELWDHLFRYLSPAPLRWHQPPPEPLAGEAEALLDQVGASLEAGGKAPQETLVRRGVYWHLRRRAEELPLQDPRSSAYFWAVRELAFGSMYRQNRTGGFNVPYGGTSYDRKRLLPLIEGFLAKEGRALLQAAEILCADFEETLRRTPPGAFLFLDPPYLTRFSQYGGRPFTLEDHLRLYRFLSEYDGPFLLVVAGPTNEVYLPLPHQKRLLRGRFGFGIKGRIDPRTEYLLLWA